MIGKLQLLVLVLPFLNANKTYKLYQLVVDNAEFNGPNNPKSVTSVRCLLAHNTKFEIGTSAQGVYQAIINEELHVIALISDEKFTTVIRIFDLETGNKIQTLTSGMYIDNTIGIRVVGFAVDDKSDRMLLQLQNPSSGKYNAIQPRSMNDIDKVIDEIEIEESMDVTPMSNAPNTATNACAISGFYPTFWMLDFVNNKCIKCQSKNLGAAHSSSFIEQKYIGGVSNKGKNGLIEIWDKNSNNYNNYYSDAQCVWC